MVTSPTSPHAESPLYVIMDVPKRLSHPRQYSSCRRPGTRGALSDGARDVEAYPGGLSDPILIIGGVALGALQSRDKRPAYCSGISVLRCFVSGFAAASSTEGSESTAWDFRSTLLLPL